MQKLTCEEQIAHRDAERQALEAEFGVQAERTKGIWTFSHWRDRLDNRQRRLIENCQIYAQNDPAGLPGHNLMLIVSNLADLLDGDGAKSRKLGD